MKGKLTTITPDPCQGCSECCEHVAIEIDAPTTLNDFEEILWFIIHKKVWVWIDEDDDSWQVQFDSACRWLEDHRCKHYEARPQICRDYPSENCVRHGEGELYKYTFREPEDLFNYLKKRRPKMYEKLSAKEKAFMREYPKDR